MPPLQDSRPAQHASFLATGAACAPDPVAAPGPIPANISILDRHLAELNKALDNHEERLRDVLGPRCPEPDGKNAACPQPASPIPLVDYLEQFTRRVHAATCHVHNLTARLGL